MDRIRIFATLFFLIHISWSCNERLPEKDKQTIYHFTFHPNPGDKFYYDFNNQTTSQQKLNGEWAKTINTSEIGIAYEASQDSLGNLVLGVRFDKVKLAVKKPDGSEREIDAATAGTSFDPTDKPFALFKDAHFTVTLNKKQEVVSIQGYDEFIQRVKNSIGADEHGKQVMEAALNQLMGADFLRKSFEQQFHLFPDSSLLPGATWQKQGDDRTGMNLTLKDTYTFESVKNGTAFVTLNSDIKMENQTLQVTGYTATVSLTGSRQGELEADTKTGMLIKNKIEQNVEGEIQVVGKDVPVKIQSTFHVVKRS